MSQSTIASDYFRHETAAIMPASKADGLLTTFALGNAALAAICLALACFLADPWFAGLLFVATYGLFWMNLRGAMK